MQESEQGGRLSQSGGVEQGQSRLSRGNGVLGDRGAPRPYPLRIIPSPAGSIRDVCACRTCEPRDAVGGGGLGWGYRGIRPAGDPRGRHVAAGSPNDASRRGGRSATSRRRASLQGPGVRPGRRESQGRRMATSCRQPPAPPRSIRSERGVGVPAAPLGMRLIYSDLSLSLPSPMRLGVPTDFRHHAVPQRIMWSA
jgi:hypothetical protein